MDMRHLVAGSTLYLPVFNEGALLYTGDGHGAQGDGEVDGSALEMSLTPTLQIIVHKDAGRDMKWPRAEDAGHYYAMGMDGDLEVALRNAVQEAVDFLRRHAGLSVAEAYALCTLNVDFRIGEAVNVVKMVYGVIRKTCQPQVRIGMSVLPRRTVSASERDARFDVLSRRETCAPGYTPRER